MRGRGRGPFRAERTLRIAGWSSCLREGQNQRNLFTRRESTNGIGVCSDEGGSIAQVWRDDNNDRGMHNDIVTENDCHEKLEIKRCIERSQMLRLRRHRISDGLAAGPAQPQDLSAALQAVPRQGPNKAGLKNDKPRHPGDTPATPTRPAYPLADVNDASDTSNA
jgi:hypothetical protein